MKLKARIKSLDEVPEALRVLYTQQGDFFVLSEVEGLVPKEKLDEFRDNNIQLKKQLEDIAEKYKDIDPAKAREAQEQLQKLTDKKLIDEGKLDELLQQRTDRMRADFESQTKALKAAADDWEKKFTSVNGQLSKVLIDSEITKAATAAGVRASAVEDVLLRGRNVFRLDNGKVVPYDGDNKPIYGKTGTEYLSINEWIEGLAKNAGHLFEQSKGGGAGSQDRGGSGGVISREDTHAMSANLEKIASGEIRVTS